MFKRHEYALDYAFDWTMDGKGGLAKQTSRQIPHLGFYERRKSSQKVFDVYSIFSIFQKGDKAA